MKGILPRKQHYYSSPNILFQIFLWELSNMIKVKICRDLYTLLLIFFPTVKKFFPEVGSIFLFPHFVPNFPQMQQNAYVQKLPNSSHVLIRGNYSRMIYAGIMRNIHPWVHIMSTLNKTQLFDGIHFKCWFSNQTKVGPHAPYSKVETIDISWLTELHYVFSLS